MRGKYKRSQKEYAEQYACSLTTIQTHWREGAPLDDPAAMRALFEAQRSAPQGAEPETLTEAKLKKTLIECDRLQLKLDEERKALIPFSVVETWLAGIAAAVESGFDAIIAEAPRWAGMTPAKAQEKAKEAKKRITKEFHAAPRRLLS